ncbi:MAG: bifunctional pyr operon transcriptional regulator/uracil phosphoribosyltransferase PyrR [Ruminococcus sp.]|nr:bifunctional pyr operon transcriptional regulator/uracil phosphoribosyltransferase PyrR [Ruminococcus sp.]
MKLKAQLLSESDISRVLKRIAHQIIEKNRGTKDLCLIGIKSRGVPLAQRLADNIYEIDGNKVEVGELDITHYRDDIEKDNYNPVLTKTKVDFCIKGKTVVLIDDVIFTGRTARAALDAVLDLGRPSKIQLCVLIDRGHSELPIKANFVGKNIPTSLDEAVAVRLSEYDGENSVAIYTK